MNKKQPSLQQIGELPSKRSIAYVTRGWDMLWETASSWIIDSVLVQGGSIVYIPLICSLWFRFRSLRGSPIAKRSVQYPVQVLCWTISTSLGAHSHLTTPPALEVKIRHNGRSFFVMRDMASGCWLKVICMFTSCWWHRLEACGQFLWERTLPFSGQVCRFFSPLSFSAWEAFGNPLAGWAVILLMLWVVSLWPFVIYWNSPPCFLLREAWNERESVRTRWLWYQKRSWWDAWLMHSLKSRVIGLCVSHSRDFKRMLYSSPEQMPVRLVTCLKHFTTFRNPVSC